MSESPAALARLREAEREIGARRPEQTIVPSLERISALASLLADPQRACPVIHITGTNGKTTTARMTETLLRARGLRTGLFTSPQLSSMRERICIDGEPLSADDFVAAYEDVAPYAAMVDGQHAVPLSFFELLTGMAFAAFADAPVDVAVIEVGLGGTWDATNIADGVVAAITPIAIDHTVYLGDTVGAIATEKAGIIKPGATAVLARQVPEAAGPLLLRAAEVGANVVREDEDFGVTDRELAVGGQRLALRGLAGSYSDVLLPLFGAYQAANAACALAAVEAFSGAGAVLARGSMAPSGTLPSPGTPPDPHGPDPDGSEPPGAAGPGDFVTEPGAALDEDLVREAFATVTAPGRLEVVRRSPVMIVDSAHNPAGMAASLDAVTEAFGFGTLVAVLAVSADKDVAGILAEMEPVVDALVTTQNSAARSMGADELAGLAVEVFGPDRIVAAPRLDDAIEAATALADEAAGDSGLGGAGILITGSTTTAGEGRTLLGAPGIRDQVSEGAP